jgi:type I restriction enzyme S subunit
MPTKLPTGWVRTTLGEVCAINPRERATDLLPDDAEVSFVRMAAVEEGSGRLDASDTRPLGTVRRGYTPFEENDVIFAKITPCMENGKIALATGLKNGVAYGSTEFIVFRSYEGVLPRLVLHFLLQPSFLQAAEHQMSGASGQKRVPVKYLFDHEFLLPPTDEQARIVAKLDSALAAIERAEIAARRAQERIIRYRDAVVDAAACGELSRVWRVNNPGASGTSNATEAFRQRLLADRRARWEEEEHRRMKAARRSPKNDKWKSRYREAALPRMEGLPETPRQWA